MPASARTILLGFCLLLVLALAPASAQYTIVAQASQQLGPIDRTETVVQVGTDPIARFKMTRLAKRSPGPEPRAVIFFLPPLGEDFTTYEHPNPGQGLNSSIAGFFALRNFVVYGYSSRAEGIAAGTCEAGLIDCSAMADWNLQTVVEDVDFVRQQIASADAGLAVFVGGFSLGSMSAIASLDEHPEDYAGAFLWEGTLLSLDPAVNALNAAYCAGVEAQLGAGLLFDGVGGSLASKTATLTRIDRDGLTPNPLFPPFFTNHQTLVAQFAEPPPGPVTMPLPGYVLVAGSVAEDRFFFADDDRTIGALERFNDYVALATVRDVSCSLAGIETSYTDELGAFDGPILALGGELAFGSAMQDVLDATGSDDTTLFVVPGFGHADQLLTLRHRQVVEFPILRWLRARL